MNITKASHRHRMRVVISNRKINIPTDCWMNLKPYEWEGTLITHNNSIKCNYILTTSWFLQYSFSHTPLQPSYEWHIHVRRCATLCDAVRYYVVLWRILLYVRSATNKCTLRRIKSRKQLHFWYSISYPVRRASCVEPNGLASNAEFVTNFCFRLIINALVIYLSSGGWTVVWRKMGRRRYDQMKSIIYHKTSLLT